MKLVVSLATRNRPQQLLETIAKSTANLALDNTAFMVQVDEDDKPTIDALHAAPLDKRVQVHVHPRPDTIAEKWNRALVTPADVYLTAADDDPFAVKGYDQIILESAKVFPDGFGMVYGDMANASFTGVTAFTAKWVEAMGYIFPPYFPYWFVDHWTDDLARLTGRYVYAPVRTDQSKAGKTQEMREPGWWATWFDAAYLWRERIAFEIVNSSFFQTPEWQKEVLRRNAPFVAHRSRWINDNVRTMSPNVDWANRLNPPDERYIRIKQRAIDMVPRLLDDYGMDSQEAHRYRTLLTPPTKVVGLARAWA